MMERQGEPADVHKEKGFACLLPEVAITLQVTLCYYVWCLPIKVCLFLSCIAFNRQHCDLTFHQRLSGTLQIIQLIVYCPACNVHPTAALSEHWVRSGWAFLACGNISRSDFIMNEGHSLYEFSWLPSSLANQSVRRFCKCHLANWLHALAGN